MSKGACWLCRLGEGVSRGEWVWLEFEAWSMGVECRHVPDFFAVWEGYQCGGCLVKHDISVGFRP